MSYNRYSKLIKNGEVLKMPNIMLSVKSTDLYRTYEKGKTRLDKISYETYGDSNYDWLILLANQDVASLEFEIPNGTELRIPYPLDTTLSEYEDSIEKYNSLYGID